jgi:hypothetical protein
MAKLLWVVFCERTVIDSGTNNVSLINLIEELHPARPTPEQLKEAGDRTVYAGFQCALASGWTRSKATKPEQAQIMLRLFDPKGQQCLELQQPLNLRDNPRARVVANSPGVPIVVEGLYVWRVYVRQSRRWQEVGSVPYELKYLGSAREAERLGKAARKQAAKSAEPIVVLAR